jgi:hypothetical protein
VRIPVQILKELRASRIEDVVVERPDRFLRARFVNLVTEIDAREAAMLLEAGARDRRTERP